jgi:hypothetical protein
VGFRPPLPGGSGRGGESQHVAVQYPDWQGSSPALAGYADNGLIDPG